MHTNIGGDFQGFSMAMYSTWIWHRPTRSMFDAGEGVSSYMRNYIFAIENIFLTHGHHDHLGGIPGVTLARGAARGDKGKPFSVYYPDGWRKIDALKSYVSASSSGMMCDIQWKTIEPDQEVQVDDAGKVFVRAFRVDHSRNLLCLGYSIVEKRTRLRSDLVGKTGAELAAIARTDGRDAIKEPYEQVVAVYSGDCTSVNPDHIRGANILFHEATFVNGVDMASDGGHSSVRSAIKTACEADVDTVVLYHVSTRYTIEAARAEARKAARDFGFGGRIGTLSGFDLSEIIPENN